MNLSKFDPHSIAQGRTVLLIGKRNTGKSVLMRWLLNIMKDKIELPIAFSPTNASVELFKEFIPETLIHEAYDEVVVMSIINGQRELAKSGKRLRSICLILDDCMYDAKIMKSKSMRDLFMNGRHLNLSIFIAVQYCMDIPSWARSNTDYVFQLKDSNVTSRKKLYDHFFGIFGDFKTFTKVFTQCTEDYQCLVMDNTQSSNAVEECVTWFKAETEYEPFKIGSEAFWRMYENPQSVREQEDTRDTSDVKQIII